MKNLILKLVQKINNLIDYVTSLDSDKEIYQCILFVRMEIFQTYYYFGPFYNMQKIDQWLDENHLRHFKYTLLDVRHPDLPRDEWPF